MLQVFGLVFLYTIAIILGVGIGASLLAILGLILFFTTAFVLDKIKGNI